MASEHQVIESKLAELAGEVDWPDGDVTARVRQRIVADSRGARRLPVRWRAAVAVFAAMAVILVVPAGRQAVADLLGVAGIEITFIDEAPSTDPAPLELGEPVSLEEAADRLGFPMALPTLSEMGAPHAIHLQERPPGIAHITWDASPHLPAVAGTDIGLLLTQFKTPDGQTVFSKELTERTDVKVTAVGDQRALWIAGAPHQLTYQTIDGTHTREVSRLAANVLIWERSGVTYRLESSLDLGAARRIAEGVSPATP